MLQHSTEVGPAGISAGRQALLQGVPLVGGGGAAVPAQQPRQREPITNQVLVKVVCK